MIRTVQRVTCIACGGKGEALYRDLQDRLYNAPGTWTIVQCTNPACRLLWLDPAPHPDDLGELYKEYYTHGDDANWGAAKRLRRSAYEFLVDVLLAPFGITAEMKRSHAMFLDEQPAASLLDVGCGDGGFLKSMADRGWAVTGVDFDPAAVRGIRDRLNLEAHVGTAESMVATRRKFDVVTASHVIEHVPDPIGFLATCATLLKEGGRLVIKTPNAASIGHFSYGGCWYALDPPRHLYVFSRPSLIACGDKAGLSLLSCFSTDASANHVLMASHFVRRHGGYRWELMSKLDRVTALAISPLLALRARFEFWRNSSSGEELVAVFQTRA